MAQIYLVHLPARLVVNYHEGNDDSETLSNCVGVTPGAGPGDIFTEPPPQGVWGESAVWERAFAITPSNVVALWLTGFDWTPEALKAGMRRLVPPFGRVLSVTVPRDELSAKYMGKLQTAQQTCDLTDSQLGQLLSALPQDHIAREHINALVAGKITSDELDERLVALRDLMAKINEFVE